MLALARPPRFVVSAPDTIKLCPCCVSFFYLLCFSGRGCRAAASGLGFGGGGGYLKVTNNRGNMLRRHPDLLLLQLFDLELLPLDTRRTNIDCSKNNLDPRRIWDVKGRRGDSREEKVVDRADRLLLCRDIRLNILDAAAVETLVALERLSAL